MKFLFNATTNIAGGGAKNSAAFIQQAALSNQHDWHFAVSPQVADIVFKWGVPNDQITIFEQSPARSHDARRRLKMLEQEGGFDLVYTMAGPAYVKFSGLHIMGISNPYISHADIGTFMATRPAGRWLPDALKIAYQAYHARNAQRLVFQTDTARQSFCRRLNFSRDRTDVIPNAFDAAGFSSVFPALFGSSIQVLVPAVAYPHKMLGRIPEIASRCVEMAPNRRISFVLTVSPGSAEWAGIRSEAERRSVSDLVSTVGVYNYADVGRIFSACDIVMSLSVLETFSATPLEAFGSSRPYISSDRPWAREISGNAALYVDPFSASDVASAILQLVDDEQLRDGLVRAGREIIELYSDQSARYRNIIKTLEANFIE